MIYCLPASSGEVTRKQLTVALYWACTTKVKDQRTVWSYTTGWCAKEEVSSLGGGGGGGGRGGSRILEVVVHAKSQLTVLLLANSCKSSTSLSMPRNSADSAIALLFKVGVAKIHREKLMQKVKCKYSSTAINGDAQRLCRADLKS